MSTQNRDFKCFKRRKTMPTQKRDFTSTSSGQPSQPKSQEWNGSEKNLMQGSCSMEEDVQIVCGEGPEHAKSHSVEYCQSCAGSALKDIVQRMHSMENSISKLFREELELVQSHIVKQFSKELELVKSYFARQVKEVVPEISSLLEDTSRRVVREELEHANSQSAQPLRSSGKCGKKDVVRNLQLRFKTRLSLPLFTGQKLEGEHGAAIVVELINANTGNIVESGPESSVKLDVVVLDGGFNKEDDDYWTQEEFEKNVVKEREGKRPLLTGNLEVVLKRGTGELGELEFTDNSCWIRSKKFRLGLRLSPGYCENICICEAKTEAFTVKEHRGESYKKHYPPASADDVWRLANIAKDGPSHKKLNEAGIYKVDEFLRQHLMDSKKLRNILGKGMTDKKWKVLLDHAKNCTRDGKFYVYYRGNESDHGVIINNVGQLCGLTANGEFRAIDRFALQNKDYADRLVKKACENWNDVRQFDPEASSDSMPEKISCSFLSAARGDRQCCHPVQDNMPPPRLASQVGLNVPPITSASTGEEKCGITVAQLPIQSQRLNSHHATGNPTIDSLDQMEPSTNTNVQPSGSFPGNSGIPAAPLAIQSQSLNSQNATWNRISDSLNQMEPSTDTNVQPSGSFPEKNGITVAQLPIQSQSLNSQHAPWNPTIDSLNRMEPSTKTNVQSSGSFPGNSGIPAAPLAIQSQSLNSQNATWNRISDSLNQMEPSTDTNVQPSGSFPGNSGITAARLPIQSQSPNSQHAMWSPSIYSWNQMGPSTDANVQPSESFPGKSVITIAELPIQWQSFNSQQATWNPIIDSLDQMEPPADTNIQQFGSFPGNSGIPPLALSPGNSGIPAPWNQMEPSIDSNVQPSGRFPGNSGIVAAGLPIQLHNQIIDSSNQKEPSADINVQPFGQPYGPPSSFQASNTEGDWIDRLTKND